jgi:hypothetical protein
VFKLSLKRRGGVVQANAAAKFTFTASRDDFSGEFADEGLLRGTGAAPVARTMHVALLLDGVSREADVPLSWRVTRGRKGTATTAAR